MPCTRCGKKVINSSRLRVRYCVCGECNHCHVGYVSHSNALYGRHWWKKKTKGIQREPLVCHPCQSHGGHGAIPDS